MNKADLEYMREFKEPYRPQFHFSPPKYWMNDPNGLVFFDGEYHLFYQHNPQANSWGHMSWGHAISEDLIHWQHLPVALREENDIMIFSGCVVADNKNSSGFSESTNKKVLVAVYTAHNTKNGKQAQCLAYSNDRGRKWHKYVNNPVLDISSKAFRDPKVFWYNESSRWIMVVALADARKVHFYSSQNLKDWNFLSEFGPAGAVNGVWECPDLFPLRVRGISSRVKWVLKVDLAEGAQYSGSGGQYFTGNFDGEKFKADDTSGDGCNDNDVNWIDQGKDFYAAVTFANMSSGRVVWLGWLANWQYAEKVPTEPWKNLLTIPRELGLILRNGKLILTQNPVKELKMLRDYSVSFRDIKLSGIQTLPDDFYDAPLLEIKAEFECGNGETKDFGFEFFPERNKQLTVVFNCIDNRLFVNRKKNGLVDFHPEFSGLHCSTLKSDQRTILLHIFIDSCSIEIFVNNGESIFTDLIFPESGKFKHKIFANESVNIKSLYIWRLKSIWNF